GAGVVRLPLQWGRQEVGRRHHSHLCLLQHLRGGELRWLREDGGEERPRGGGAGPRGAERRADQTAGAVGAGEATFSPAPARKRR
ncbi:unnamed protein product, partial [Effrenium voratum]